MKKNEILSHFRYVMQITNEGDVLAQDQIYFVASEEYLGDKRSSYGYTFSFSLSVDLAAPEGW